LQWLPLYDKGQYIEGVAKIRKGYFSKTINLNELIFFTADKQGFMGGCRAQPHPQKNREIALNQNNETGSIVSEYFFQNLSQTPQPSPVFYLIDR